MSRDFQIFGTENGCWDFVPTLWDTNYFKSVSQGGFLQTVLKDKGLTPKNCFLYTSKWSLIRVVYIELLTHSLWESVLATLNLVVNFTMFSVKPLQKSLRTAFQCSFSEEHMTKMNDMFQFIKCCPDVLKNYHKLGGSKQQKCVLYSSWVQKCKQNYWGFRERNASFFARINLISVPLCLCLQFSNTTPSASV